MSKQIEEQARREAEAWVKAEIDEAMLERRDIAEFCYAAALIAERTKAQPPASPWISVQDRLPEPHKGVLLYRPDWNRIVIGSLDGGKFYIEGTYWATRLFTHWMSTPPKP